MTTAGGETGESGLEGMQFFVAKEREASRQSNEKDAKAMKSNSQAYFEKVCARRMQAYLAMEMSPDEDQEQTKHLAQLMAVLDQTCLDLSTQRLLTTSDLQRAEHWRQETAVIQPPLPVPLWLQLEEPQPAYGMEPGEGDEWAVAALFFRAPMSAAMFRHALLPPLANRPLPEGVNPPNWFEWRLDVIDPNGDSFHEYSYYYDERTCRWRIMETHLCPWELCARRADEELGYEVVVPCEQCQQALHYYSRLLATVVRENLGQPLALKNVAWERRKQAATHAYALRGSGGKDEREDRLQITSKRKQNGARTWSIRAHRPFWFGVTMANLEGSSRLLLIYDANDFDARQGLISLSSIAAVTEDDARETSLLPPPERGYAQFGVAGLQVANMRSSEGNLARVRWVFALEWERTRLPWETLLHSLDTLRPPQLAFPEAYTLPVLFVAAMAALRPRSTIQQRVQCWGPLLEEAQRKLQPLIDVLFLAWAAGPTSQASAHRQFGECIPRIGEVAQRILDRCAAAFGPDRIEELRRASRPESALLRLLEEMSRQIWQAEQERRERLLAHLGEAFLQALLPVACWRERKERVDYLPERGSALEDLYRFWQGQTGQQGLPGRLRRSAGNRRRPGGIGTSGAHHTRTDPGDMCRTGPG